MAVHITRAHGLTIGADAGADVTVQRTEGGVRIVLQKRMFEIMDKNRLMRVMELAETEFTLSTGEYIEFLGRLHAYLTLTPPKPRK